MRRVLNSCGLGIKPLTTEGIWNNWGKVEFFNACMSVIYNIEHCVITW